MVLADRVVAHLRGLGELDAYVRDEGIDEVLVNAGREIWIDRGGALHYVGSLDADSVELLIERVLAPLGRRVDRTSPIVDARLADGARICAVLPPVAVDGPMLSIRRFRRRILPLDSFTDDVGIGLARQLLRARCNLVVTGATSSGKTSLVAALVSEVEPSQRLVVVEDTAELPLRHPHAVRLEARPPSVDGPGAVDLAQLVRTALRLRPDRIVVGEVRGDEVLALVQATEHRPRRIDLHVPRQRSRRRAPAARVVGAASGADLAAGRDPSPTRSIDRRRDPRRTLPRRFAPDRRDRRGRSADTDLRRPQRGHDSNGGDDRRTR